MLETRFAENKPSSLIFLTLNLWGKKILRKFFESMHHICRFFGRSSKFEYFQINKKSFVKIFWIGHYIVSINKNWIVKVVTLCNKFFKSKIHSWKNLWRLYVYQCLKFVIGMKNKSLLTWRDVYSNKRKTNH